MSYINKALKKAQRDKDSRVPEYAGILSLQKRVKKRFTGSTLVWVCFGVAVCLLAFAAYSWFDSDDQPLPVVKKDEPEKLIKASVKKTPAPTAPVKKIAANDTEVKNAKELYEKAKTFHKIGRLTNAKRLYQDALKADPGFVDALNNLGVIYLYEKDFKMAQTSFETAIRLKPGQVDPYYNLACVCALSGEIKLGISHLKTACSLDPEAKKWAREDTDLRNLWGNPEFEEIIRD